jgi:hypothetical protein
MSILGNVVVGVAVRGLISFAEWTFHGGASMEPDASCRPSFASKPGHPLASGPDGVGGLLSGCEMRQKAGGKSGGWARNFGDFSAGAGRLHRFGQVVCSMAICGALVARKCPTPAGLIIHFRRTASHSAHRIR